MNQLRADDAGGADKARAAIRKVGGHLAALGEILLVAEEVGHHPLKRDVSAQEHPMLAVIGENPVVVFECGAYAC